MDQQTAESSRPLGISRTKIIHLSAVPNPDNASRRQFGVRKTNIDVLSGYKRIVKPLGATGYKRSVFKVGGALTRQQARRQKLNNHLSPDPDRATTSDSLALSDGLHGQEDGRDDGDAHKGEEDVDGIEGHEDQENSVAQEEAAVQHDGVDQAEEAGQEQASETGPELETSNSDFDHDTVVVENEFLKGHIYLSFHRHQKIFSSHDHIYRFYFEPKTKSPVLWSSIEDILEQALDKIIEHLQKKYANDKECYVYFTINQDNLSTGLRASPHVLSENSVYSMVQNVLSTFHRYINSNQNVALNDTFEITFKVLSGLHVNYPGHRRKAVPFRTLVGAPETPPEFDKLFLAGGLINLYALKNISHCFTNQCLLVTLLYLYFRFVQTDLFQKVSSLTKHTSKQTKKGLEIALDTFQQYIIDFCTATGIPENGPHDVYTVANSFSNYFKCQIIVIASIDGSVPSYTLYPSLFDLNLPRLYCFLKANHAFGILNLTAFFRLFKRTICFTCKRFQYFWNTSRHHKCPNVPCCFWCHGILKKPSHVTHAHERLVYCDSDLNDSKQSPVTCQICQNEFKSKLCFDNHFTRCKNHEMPYYCRLCNTLVARNRQRIVDVKNNHVCGDSQVRCKTCFQLATANHTCEVLKAAKCKTWPIMATLTMFFLNNSHCDSCNECYLLKLKYASDNNMTWDELNKSVHSKLIVCPDHATPTSHHLQTNAICVWFESQRFMFREKLFLDDCLPQPKEFEKFKISHYCNAPLPYTTKVVSKHLKGISKNLKSVLDQVYSTAEQKFFQFVIQECSNVSFVVENDVAMLKLLDLCLTFDFLPRVTQKGSRVFALELTQIGVKFINFCNYIPGTFTDWLDQFNISNPAPYFPQKLNTFQNMASQECRSLSFSDFVEFGDGPSSVTKKRAFFDTIDQSISLKSLLVKTLVLRSELFFNVVIRYLKQSMDLQSLLATVTNKVSDCTAIHPFTDYIMSCSSYIMALCQFFYLNDFTICSIANPYNSTACPISQGEYEYTSYMAYARPELEIKNAFTASAGELRFGHITVDGYSAVNKTVYDFRGDWTHCHLPELCLNPDKKEKNVEFCKKKREQDNKTVDTLKTKFFSRVSNVETIYECVWNDFKKKNKEEIERFWNKTGLPKNRPLIRLTPRAAVRGGFLETYRLKYLASENHDISWIDANSLYSYIAMNCNLPIGSYQTLTFFDLKDQCHLNAENGQFYFKGSSMEADVAMVEILVPSSLKQPFLSFRVKDEFVFMANCRTCSQKKMTKPCKHKNHQRSFTSVWTCVELAYAVKELGYVILNWLEVHHFSESRPVLQKFVKILASQKLKHSNLYSKCSTLEEKQKYCDMLNAKMGFSDPNLKLNLSSDDNPMAKNYFKHALNSLYGRFALHGERIKHAFAKSIHEIQAIASNQSNEILSLTSINDNIIEVTYINKSTVNANRYSNLYYTALINAHGRIFIYNLAKNLTSLGCDVLSIDTDAIIFGHPKSFKVPVTFSHCFGDFKPVLGDNAEICAYYSLGCRSYIVVYNENGCQKYITKVKGLSLTSFNSSGLITPQIFDHFLNQHFQDEIDKLFVPQSRKQFKPQTRTFSNLIRSHEFSNEIHVKRFIIPNDCDYRTYPYGFDFQNVAV